MLSGLSVSGADVGRRVAVIGSKAASDFAASAKHSPLAWGSIRILCLVNSTLLRKMLHGVQMRQGKLKGKLQLKICCAML